MPQIESPRQFVAETLVRVIKAPGLPIKVRNRAALAEGFDAADVQILCVFQFQQLITACDVAAKQASVRDMPRIVSTAVQSNREPLLPKFLQRGIESWNHCDFYTHGNSLTGYAD
jgi:hypothetical protein